MDIDALMQELTLEEKARLCSGDSAWATAAIERLGIPAVTVADGPHGVRKARSEGDDLSLTATEPATCFPTAVGLAASWNRELIREVGRALGREARAAGVHVLLGPGLNIKRHPLCGRNFEYFSEDPYLAGEIAAAHVQGMADEGVGGCLKHFAANNQETRRMTIDAVVDERSLREIYLAGFEIAVRQAQPAAIMSAYNRLNGTFCSEHPWLLDQVLRREWGFGGIVMTDWGACNDRVAGVEAGQDLEMPGNGGINDAAIVAAVREGRLDESALDRVVRRMLAFARDRRGAFAAAGADTATRADMPAGGAAPAEPGAPAVETQHAMARAAAREACVLLKNEDDALPLPREASIAVLGAFAEHPRFQGAGSSQINPTRVDSLLGELRHLAPDATVTYEPGYDSRGDAPDEALLDAAVRAAAAADAAVVVAGLPDAFESEGFDRSHMRMPESHVELIRRVAAAQPRTVVVLSNGSPVEMPWVDDVPAVLESYLGGQAWGGAVADLLLGAATPSGKLAETFPLRVEDTPAYTDFPGDKSQVRYGETIFVGYRGFDARRMPVRFPFGHGLSYTSFSYRDIEVSADGNTVSCTVTNAGARAGAEVVQLYVHDPESSVVRPEQELKGFEKVHLRPGESRSVSFRLDDRSFAYWSVEHARWVVEGGPFELRVGSSSRDIRLSAQIERPSSPDLRQRFHANSMVADVLADPIVGPRLRPMYDALLRGFGSYEPGSPEALMFENVVRELPLRDIVTFSEGQLLSPEGLNRLIEVLNGERDPEELPVP